MRPRLFLALPFAPNHMRLRDGMAGDRQPTKYKRSSRDHFRDHRQVGARPMNGHGHKDAGRSSGSAIRTVLIAAFVAVVLATSVAMVAAARTIELGPRVGDILVFRQGARLPPDWEFVAIVESPDLPISCNLKPDAMASGGGSLVVEQRSANRLLYRVHWAGRQTAFGTGDCGSEADVLIPRADLQLLTNAVGGPGVEHRVFGRL
jgi:hypothetical protein